MSAIRGEWRDVSVIERYLSRLGGHVCGWATSWTDPDLFILSNSKDDSGDARDALYEVNGGGLSLFEEDRSLGGQSWRDHGMSGSDF